MSAVLQYQDENGNWVTLPQLVGPRGRQGPRGPKGAPGEMDVSVYDPQGKQQDIFAYIDAAVAALDT